jgi:hypothetical protein
MTFLLSNLPKIGGADTRVCSVETYLDAFCLLSQWFRRPYPPPERLP